MGIPAAARACGKGGANREVNSPDAWELTNQFARTNQRTMAPGGVNKFLQFAGRSASREF